LLGAGEDKVSIEPHHIEKSRRRSKSITEIGSPKARGGFRVKSNHPIFKEDVVSPNATTTKNLAISPASSMHSPVTSLNLDRGMRFAAEEPRYKRKTMADAKGKISGRWTKAEHLKFIEGKCIF